MATQEQKQALTALYIGYFDRAPDPAGLQFWIEQIDGGREFNTIAADFAASDEAEALYPYLTTPDVSSPAAFVTNIYLNLFGRIPEEEGREFWVGVLQDGSVSVGDMIEAIINGARDDVDAGTSDKTRLDNKIEAGLDFAESTADVSGFEFDAEARLAAEAAVNGVTEDPATVEDAKAATDAFINGETNVGNSFTLTAGVDTLAGTAANDTFSAPLTNNPTNNAITNSLQTLDSVDGGAGVDTLNADLAFGSYAIPQITDVENLVLRARGTDLTPSSTLDLGASSGVENIENRASTGTLNVTNVANAVALGLTSTNGATTLGYAAASPVTAQELNLDGAGTSANSAQLSVSSAAIETLTINSAGAGNNVDLLGGFGNVTDLTVEGDAGVMLTEAGNFANLETATLGGGDDSIAVDSAVVMGVNDDDDALTDSSMLEGGEGDDNLTVVMPGDGTVDVSELNFENVSGFEQLTVSQNTFDMPGGTLEFDLSETDFTSVVLDTTAFSLNGDFTLVGNDDLTELSATGTILGTGSLILKDFSTLAVNVEGNVTTVLDADGLETLSLGDVTEDNSVTVNLTLDNMDDLSSLDLTGYEGGDDADSVTIDASGAGFGSAVEIKVGSAGIEYTAGSASVRETFAFDGDDFAIVINAFESGVGGNADRLDFSGVEGIGGLDDINIVYDDTGAGETEITSDFFEGTITIVGQDLTDDAANFMFA